MARSLWTWLALLALQLGAATADNSACTCTGLDYTDGGSYLVDGSADGDFTFTSVFSSCSTPDTVQPILVGPNNEQFTCGAIEMQIDDEQQRSSCGVPYSQMSSGTWTIVIQADNTNFQVIRVFQLTVTTADHVTTTVTPTVVVVVSRCGDSPSGTRTLTQWLPAPVTTIETVVEHTRTAGVTTSAYVTTVGVAAYCH
ncbi:hypothetical protein B0T26DRAFT_639277, partial [Lasiosphaeria miniovina]